MITLRFNARVAVALTYVACSLTATDQLLPQLPPAPEPPALIQSALPDSDPVWVSLSELESGNGPPQFLDLFSRVSAGPDSYYRQAPDGSNRCLPFITRSLDALGVIGSFTELIQNLGLALVEGTVLRSDIGLVAGRLGTLLTIAIDSLAFPAPDAGTLGIANERIAAKALLDSRDGFLLAFPAHPSFTLHSTEVCADLNDMPTLPAAGDEIVVLLDRGPIDASNYVYSPLTKVVILKKKDQPPLVHENWRADPALQSAILEAEATKAQGLTQVFRQLTRLLEGGQP